MIYKIPVDPDLRYEFREGMVFTVSVVMPDRHMLDRLIVSGLEAPADVGEHFELLEIRVGGEFAWWPDYDQMLRPMTDRRGRTLTEPIATINEVSWLGKDAAITVRCTKGPKAFVATILATEAAPDHDWRGRLT